MPNVLSRRSWTSGRHIRVAVAGTEFGHIIGYRVEGARYPECSAINVELNADVVDFDDQCLDPRITRAPKVTIGVGLEHWQPTQSLSNTRIIESVVHQEMSQGRAQGLKHILCC